MPGETAGLGSLVPERRCQRIALGRKGAPSGLERFARRVGKGARLGGEPRKHCDQPSADDARRFARSRPDSAKGDRDKVGDPGRQRVKPGGDCCKGGDQQACDRTGESLRRPAGKQQAAPHRPCQVEYAIAELAPEPGDTSCNRTEGIFQGTQQLRDQKFNGRTDRQDRGRDRVLDRPHRGLARSAALRPLLLPPLERLLALALALQPALMPFPVRLNRFGLRLQPAVMVAEILFRRDEHLARPDHRLFDDGDGGLEGGDGLPVGIPVPRGPCALLTHRTDHAERLP
jgi:hypothetical protein